MRLRPLVVAASAVLLLSTGCGGESRHPGTSARLRATPVTGGPPITLPAPSQLPGMQGATRGASYVEADLRLDGADFDPALPNQRAAVDVSGAVDLTPDWAPGDPFGGLAFCTYHFLVPDYDRNSEVRVGFVPPAPADGNSYLALANWDTDLWDWYPLTAGSVMPSSLDAYFDFGGNLVAVFLQTGSAPVSLFAIRLGGLPPVAVIGADVSFGDAPLAVSLDASDSDAVEGEIVQYEWDVDGDGVFEADTTPAPSLDVEYTEGGVYNATLRVTNTHNASAMDSVEISVVAPWQHTFGSAGGDWLYALATDGDGSFYAAGVWSGDDSGVLLLRCDPLGRLEWARSFDSGSIVVAEDMALADNGDLILCGDIQIGLDRRALVQRWSPAGELLWSRHFGESTYNRSYQLVLDGENIYVGGEYTTDEPDVHLFLLRLDAMGQRVWARAWDSVRHDYFTDMAPRVSLLGYTGMILMSDSSGDANPNIRKAECSLTGNDLGMQQLQDENDAKFDGQVIQVYNIFEGEVEYYVSGRVIDDSDPTMFLGKFNSFGAGAWGIAVDFGMDLNVHDMTLDGQGHLSVAGRVSASHYEACLAQFDHLAGTFINALRLVNTGDTTAYSVTPWRKGLLLSGAAPDATSEWFNLEGSAVSNPYGFNDISHGFFNLLWNGLAAGGEVNDITGDPVIDSGGGGSDGMLMYRLVPE